MTRGAASMRDQFFDHLGGAHFLPQSTADAARTNASIDERVTDLPSHESGEQGAEDSRTSHPSDISNRSEAEPRGRSAAGRSTAWAWVAGTAVTALAALFWVGFSYREGGQTASATMPPAHVTVSKPLVRDVDPRIGLLGQFSAIDRVELRAQVGGTLTEIHFQDGQIVNKGDHLFMIDPRPYEIKLAKATAQLQTASARFALASVQLGRAQTLLRTTFGTAMTVVVPKD